MKYFQILMIFLSMGLIFRLNAQERQIPVLPEKNINTIDANRASQLSLFNEYPDFSEAKLYQINDSTYVLEIYYGKKGHELRVRNILNTEELGEFRSKIMILDRHEGGKLALDQSGRALLLSESTVLGFLYYGWTVPMVIDVNELKTAVALYMFSAGSSFLIPYLTTKNIEVTKGEALSTFHGQYWGIAHGIYLAQVIDDGKSEKFSLVSGIVGSVAEASLFYRFARSRNYSTGDAAITNLGMDFGHNTGLMLTDVLNFLRNENRRAAFSTLLISSAAGTYLGVRFANSRTYTFGDAWYFRTAISIGRLSSLAVVNWFEPDDSKPYTLGTIVGGTLGGLYAWSWLSGKDLSTGQGIMSSLGALSGGLFGVGIGYLISSEKNQDQAMLTSAMLGSIAGFGLMSWTYKKELNRNNAYNMHFHFNPTGLIAHKMINSPELLDQSLFSFQMSF